MKRSIIGSYHHVSVKHLPAYLDEMEFRLNRRENPYLFRDVLLVLLGGDALPYAKLIERKPIGADPRANDAHIRETARLMERQRRYAERSVIGVSSSLELVGHGDEVLCLIAEQLSEEGSVLVRCLGLIGKAAQVSERSSCLHRRGDRREDECLALLWNRLVRAGSSCVECQCERLKRVVP